MPTTPATFTCQNEFNWIINANWIKPVKNIFDNEIILEGMLDSKQFYLEVFVYDLFESDHEKLFPKLVLRVLLGYPNTSKQ